MLIALRPGLEEDFDYCKRLYFAELNWIMNELHLDSDAQEVGFRQLWKSSQVRIITLDGLDVGWLQTTVDADDLFLAQMVVDGPFQRKGIGTEVMNRLVNEALSGNHAMRLNVVKINPARRLYERLGFSVTHEDERKFYMRRNADAARASH